MTETSESMPRVRKMVDRDIISKLPSDILISIISRLTLREATLTSILSTRWRYLHTYISHLNFPKRRDATYLSIINHVLNSYRGGRIKELGVDIYCLACCYFKRWFEFALTKKAKIVHMSMHHKGLEFLRLPNMNSGLKCLKDLSLSRIEMTHQDIELLVSNCLALECLKIEFSVKLENVSIVGHLKLKHLNLSYLWGVRSVVIRDTISLVSLTCCEWRRGCSVQLSNIPKLTKLDLRECPGNLKYVELLAGMTSCIRHQLQLLCLSARVFSMYHMDPELLINFSVGLVNIKHLELVLGVMDNPYSFYFSRYACRLVEACSSLEKLVIKFPHRPQFYDEVKAETYDQPRSKLSLKYLEITGYLGSPSLLELALYVINNVKALQKLTVVSCNEEALACARRHFCHIKSVCFLVI